MNSLLRSAGRSRRARSLVGVSAFAVALVAVTAAAGGGPPAGQGSTLAAAPAQAAQIEPRPEVAAPDQPPVTQAPVAVSTPTAPGPRRPAATPGPTAGTPQPARDGEGPAPAIDSGLAADGIPSVALEAYRRAARSQPAACGLPWPLLAAIGRVESDHGRFAAALLRSDGTSNQPVIGIPLDGRGTALIRDTDHGRLDGDRVFDRAVGPMQFIPSTWAGYGVDGNGDHVVDPFNIFDAAAAAARYLCAAGQNLQTLAGQRRAVLAYNDSDAYLATVFSLEKIYAAGVLGVTIPVLGVEPVPPARAKLAPVDPGRPAGLATRAKTAPRRHPAAQTPPAPVRPAPVRRSPAPPATTPAAAPPAATTRAVTPPPTTPSTTTPPPTSPACGAERSSASASGTPTASPTSSSPTGPTPTATAPATAASPTSTSPTSPAPATTCPTGPCATSTAATATVPATSAPTTTAPTTTAPTTTAPTTTAPTTTAPTTTAPTTCARH